MFGLGYRWRQARCSKRAGSQYTEVYWVELSLLEMYFVIVFCSVIMAINTLYLGIYLNLVSMRFWDTTIFLLVDYKVFGGAIYQLIV